MPIPSDLEGGVADGGDRETSEVDEDQQMPLDGRNSRVLEADQSEMRHNTTGENNNVVNNEEPRGFVGSGANLDMFLGFPDENDQNDVNENNNEVANYEEPAEDDNDSIESFLGFPREDRNTDGDSLEKKSMSQVLQFWEANHTQIGFDPVPVLKRLAEIFDHEAELYMRKDPDPFDERHPYRTDPSCGFGSLLKQLFRKDLFMNKLVNDYLRENYFTRQNVQKSSVELNILACRLILVIMPGLETAAVFQGEYENLISRIYSWAEDSIEPLQSYATGLIAAAMEVNDIAVNFREMNTRLIPKMIKRLHMLQAVYKSNRISTLLSMETPTSSTSAKAAAVASLSGSSATADHHPSSSPWSSTLMRQKFNGTESGQHSPSNLSNGDIAEAFVSTNSNLSSLLENSQDASPINASRYYKKMYIPLHPSTVETSQMLILRYLTSMGEYQEFLGLVFELDAMRLIFRYIENLDGRDTCLAFEALKYLASLLCHKKFTLEFIAHGGLDLLLKVPRPSIAATGVSITLYYLAYSEDAMERICSMPRPIISKLVHYALWILGRSYDSGKCHATMFFGLSFQFKVILDEFDAQDGLRKLYNVISILKILNPSNNEGDDNNSQNEDVECAARQLVRQVCVALKRYMETHLFFKYNEFMYRQYPASSEFSQNVIKATKCSFEQISEQIRTLQENTSARSCWWPVYHLMELGAIKTLLKIIAILSDDWNSAGKTESCRSALDVLSICCVVPKVFSVFREMLDLPDYLRGTGVYILLTVAAGDLGSDVEVQKSALAVICNCVCSPILRGDNLMQMPNFNVPTAMSRKNKQNYKYSEELVEKIWEAVCSNNGIIILLSLMQTKSPITDADCIRGMACRALAGLARSERVRQIIGKLPLFTSGQIQTLMRDPILQEKRAEHVVFQKYVLELLEHVSGKTKSLKNQIDPSLSNIHKANIVAQTKIQYNDQQLNQLIYEHFISKGLSSTAETLKKEAGLQLPSTSVKTFHQSPFDYKVMPAITSSLSRSRIRNRVQELNTAINNAASSSGGASGSAGMSVQTLQQQPQQQQQHLSIMGQMSATATSSTPTASPLFVNSKDNNNENLQNANMNFFSNSEYAFSSHNTSLSGSGGTPMSDNYVVTPIKLIKKINEKPLNTSTDSYLVQRSMQKQINVITDNTNNNNEIEDTTMQFHLHSSGGGVGGGGGVSVGGVSGVSGSSSNLLHHQQTNTAGITLNTIVTEYLTNQHALCKNPMTTCPQFDLFKPHKCPEPKPSRLHSSCGNLTARIFNSQAGFNTMRYDRLYVHTHFTPLRTLRDESIFTVCDISEATNVLHVGYVDTTLKAFNINDGTELMFGSVPSEAPIEYLVSNRAGNMLITCDMDYGYVHKIKNDEYEYLFKAPVFLSEFGNTSQDRILGCTNNKVSIYDLTTTNLVQEFKATISNNYTHNRATFHPTDELILSDGVLWDVKSGKEIHKFDKLNDALSGVFHPNGVEIISNTEVWDLRTFHLLQTVPALDQCNIIFSPQRVMYAVSVEETRLDYNEATNLGTSFKVLDAYDYSSIATIDVKRRINDICVNRHGNMLALVENQAETETIVKIYGVGVKKSEQEEDKEEEDEDDDMETSHSEDDDDDDDDDDENNDGGDDDNDGENDDDDDSSDESDAPDFFEIGPHDAFRLNIPMRRRPRLHAPNGNNQNNRRRNQRRNTPVTRAFLGFEDNNDEGNEETETNRPNEENDNDEGDNEESWINMSGSESEEIGDVYEV